MTDPLAEPAESKNSPEAEQWARFLKMPHISSAEYGFKHTPDWVPLAAWEMERVHIGPGRYAVRCRVCGLVASDAHPIDLPPQP